MDNTAVGKGSDFLPEWSALVCMGEHDGNGHSVFFRESKKDKIGLYPGPDLLLRGAAGEQLLLFIKWDAASKRRRFVFAYCCFHQKWIICRISAFIDRSYNINI